MPVLPTLSVLALREVVEAAAGFLPVEAGRGAVEGVVGFVVSRIADPSRRVTEALKRSVDRSWRALEIALAGESLLGRLDRAEDRAFRGQVRAFLDAIPDDTGDRGPAWRRECLYELRAVRKARRHVAGELDGADVARHAAAFLRYAEPAHASEIEWEHLAHLGEELSKCGYKFLGELVAHRVGDRQPLLVLAVRFFFRTEVARDPQLFQGLTHEHLRRLDDHLQSGFRQLGEALQERGDRLENVLESVQEVVVRTHEAVLDVVAELQRQREAGRRQHQELYQAVLALQQRLDLAGTREVRPRDSLSIRNDRERETVRQVVDRYRALPQEQRRELPALLNAIGKLEVAAGHFESAEKDFRTVADLVVDRTACAEAHFNVYRTSLERRQYDAALVELQQALSFDAERFAPFPTDKYARCVSWGPAASASPFYAATRGPTARWP
jgi:hypothetical protein